ncbi:MAG: DUF167 domain-containing protein [Rickettsiales bacterium]|jgi:uncharacterized protein YggU (UPF0235/DUF167 family)|nr:DUF167 domain-containing protein [Rickettsiales bacterium]
MKIAARIIPNSRSEGIEALPDGSIRVRVRAPAIENRANEALLRLVSKHYGAAKSSVRIARGAASRNKIIEIDS